MFTSSPRRVAALILGVALSASFSDSLLAQHPSSTNRPRPTKRNAVIFIADGLRHGSVNTTDAPTLLKLRQLGVHFVNSHGIFPTFTTANASVMATGHYLGDTGDFSNTLHPGYAIFDTGNFAKTTGTLTPSWRMTRSLPISTTISTATT